MPTFIRFTKKDGDFIWIAPEHVIAVTVSARSNTESLIYVSNDAKYFAVNGRPLEVIDRLRGDIEN